MRCERRQRLPAPGTWAPNARCELRESDSPASSWWTWRRKSRRDEKTREVRLTARERAALAKRASAVRELIDVLKWEIA